VSRRKRKKPSLDEHQMDLPVTVRPGRSKLSPRGLAARVADASALAIPQTDQDDAAAHAGDFQRPWGARCYNTLIGIGFIPIAWIVSQSLVTILQAAAHNPKALHFWQVHEFIMLALGALGCLTVFVVTRMIWGFPRPLRPYVWSHEMMHGVWAWLSGGRVRELKGWSYEGGYIVTDKYNFWIALVPYIYPFYSIPVLAAWGVAGMLGMDWEYRTWFLAALGWTWMYHVAFTIWMLPKGQTDFLGPGRIFSLVWIWLLNAVLLSLFAVMLAPDVTWGMYFEQLEVNTQSFYEWIGRGILHLWRAAHH
jgi:hypothetical protein